MNADLFRSKNERIYEHLKTKIIRGEMKPDEPIVIDTLAAQLGVSAIPIREALRQLEANGFVAIAPYVGARVAPLEAASIREVFETLEALETVSARAACERATDAELESLAQGINAMRGLTDSPDAWSAHNKALHQTVCQIAGMRLVEKMLTVALDHWDRLRCAYLDDVFAQRVADGQAEHERMLDALRRRDPDGLVEGIQVHNRAAFYAYIAHLERKGLLETAK